MPIPDPDQATDPRPASASAGVSGGLEFSLYCGHCGREMYQLEASDIYRCFPCKRAVVLRTVPRAVSGAEAVSPVGLERAALDAAGAQR